MDNAAIISGYSACLAFAKDSETLIDNLKQGKQVNRSYWFSSDAEAVSCKLDSNKLVAQLVYKQASVFDLLCELIDNALEKAGLDRNCLSGENVRVYLTGLGPRVDKRDYASFYDHNDVEDVTLTKSMQNLHAVKISQDKLAYSIADKYRLQYMPPNMNCTSNSSLAAVHLGTQAIERGGVDLVLVVNCSQITTQDIYFLAEQSMLDSELVQPFGEGSQSVLFAEGACVMLLESARHRLARQVTGGVRLKSLYTQISASRSNDAAHLSANLLKVMNKIIDESSLTCDDLCAIIPHANGSLATDKAEAQAIATLLGEHLVPVLAYKGQIGYTPTGSGIVDLIISHHSLTQGELLSPIGLAAIRENIAQYLLLNEGVVKHDKKHLLKVGLGVDGSIIGMVLSNTDC